VLFHKNSEYKHNKSLMQLFAWFGVELVPGVAQTWCALIPLDERFRKNVRPAGAELGKRRMQRVEESETFWRQ
jgi:hypothetical protein